MTMATSTIKATTDTGWVALSSSTSYRVRNGICTVRVLSASVGTSTANLGNLPTEYYPSSEIAFLLRTGTSTCQAWIDNTGGIRAVASSSASTWSGVATFIVG